MPDYHDEVTRHRKPDWLKIKLHRSEEFGEVAPRNGESQISEPPIKSLVVPGPILFKHVQNRAELMRLADRDERIRAICRCVHGSLYGRPADSLLR